MKLLFDQNISHRLIHSIRDVFPEAVQVRELGLENQSDRQIWKFAKDNQFMIVTFDADFYDFSLVWGHPPKIVWLRTHNQTTKNVENMLRKHFNTIQDFFNDSDLACLEIIKTD